MAFDSAAQLGARLSDTRKAQHLFCFFFLT
jgi:hypothetical protein